MLTIVKVLGLLPGSKKKSEEYGKSSEDHSGWINMPANVTPQIFLSSS